MQNTQSEFERVTRRFPVPLGALPGYAKPVESAARRPESGRVACVLCRRSFAWDSDEAWNRPPEEIELEGRRFLGIRDDSALCPECVGDVEVAGAERLYWALSQTL